MSYHRLLEPRVIQGRLRETGSLIDYQGTPAAHFEPLDVPEHNAWIGATRRWESFAGDDRAAA